MKTNRLIAQHRPIHECTEHNSDEFLLHSRITNHQNEFHSSSSDEKMCNRMTMALITQGVNSKSHNFILMLMTNLTTQ